MSRMRLLVACSVAGGAVLAGLWAGGASARDMGHHGTMSPDNRVFEEDFPPMPGLYPFEGAQPFSYFRPPMCRQTVWCDSHEFAVTIPDDYPDIHAVRITLTWPNPQEEDTNETGNQLTLHLWGDDGPAFGASTGPCASPRDPNCEYRHPLVMDLIDPQPDETIFMTIVNARNVNLGYALRLEFYELELPPLPVFDEGTGPRFRGGPGPAGGAPTRPTSFGDVAALPGQTMADDPEEPRTVLIPGPDGEMIEIELPVVAAAQRLDVPDERGVNPLVTALVVVVLLGALITYFTIRRRRQLREASPY